jgi:hypothetical protein
MFVRQPALASCLIRGHFLLLISLNRPMVALEDYATDEADATICTVRRESDMVSTVVHLLLQQGRTALFYTFESDPYPEDLRGPVEEEAIDFVESLGFIMDDTRFAGIAPTIKAPQAPVFRRARQIAPAGGQTAGVPDPRSSFPAAPARRLSRGPSRGVRRPRQQPRAARRGEVVQVRSLQASLQEMGSCWTVFKTRPPPARERLPAPPPTRRTDRAEEGSLRAGGRRGDLYDPVGGRRIADPGPGPPAAPAHAPGSPPPSARFNRSSP